MRTLVAVVAAVVSLGTTAASARAQDAAGELARARTLVDRGEFEAGERVLSALLATPSADAHLRARTGEVDALLAECGFRRSHPAAVAAELFGANAVVDAESGQARFTAGKPAGGLWYVPEGSSFSMLAVPFDGDVALTCTAQWHDPHSNVAALVLGWDSEARTGYVLRPGFYRTGTRQLGRDTENVEWWEDRSIVAVDPAGDVVLFHKPPDRSTLRTGVGRLTATRRGNTFTLQIDGTVIATGAEGRRRSRVGRVGVQGTGVHDVVVTGRIESGWLQSVAARDLFARFRAWKETPFGRGPRLPERLLAASPGFPDPGEGLPADAPAGKAPELLAQVRRALQGEAASIDELTRALPGLPLRTRSYAQAAILAGGGRFRAAEELAARLCDEEPEFAGALLLRGLCRAALRRSSDAAGDLARVLAARPTSRGALRASLELAIAEGDEAGAAAALDAIGAVDGGALLAFARARAARLHRGASLPRRHTAETRSYTVVSDHSRELCAQVAAALEAARVRFVAAVGADDRPAARTRVIVFSDRAAFLEHLGTDAPGLGQGTAVFVRADHQIAAHLPEDREELLRSVRRAGLRAFLARNLPPAPGWLAEGLAEVMAYGDGEPPAVFRPAFVPVRAFARLSASRLEQGDSVARAQAWALVRLLQKPRPVELRSVLRDTLRAVRAGSPPDEVEAAVLAPVMDLIEEELRK